MQTFYRKKYGLKVNVVINRIKYGLKVNVVINTILFGCGIVKGNTTKTLL